MVESVEPLRGLPLPPAGMPRVRFSRRWLGALATGTAAAGAALTFGGVPAFAAVSAAVVAVSGYALAIEPARPRLRRRTLVLPDLPTAWHGVTIAHVSDMHLGHRFSAANTRWALRQIERAAPDLVVLTGDFVQHPAAISEIAGVLAPLRAALGVYAVPGNHDYWEGFAELQAALAHLPITWLLNRHVVFERAAAPLVLAGIDDHWNGAPDLRAAFAGAPADAFRLLLAHCPDVADAAASVGAHLQLSGHTHGGHLRLPGLGPLALPRYGWRYSDGVYRVGALTLAISRGIGGAPLRFACAPELVLLRLLRHPDS